MVNNRGYIIYKVDYKKGKKYDYDIYKNDIYKKDHPVTPKEVVNVVDLGYLGVEKDFSDQLSALPYRKKRNQDLSQEEKEYNIIHSKKRIVIEHTYLQIEKVQDTCRCI